MTQSEPRIVTGLMLGTFLAFGVDTIVILAALWYAGRLPGTVAGGVSAAILLLFALWVGGRWVRLRRADRSDDDAGDVDGELRDPLDRLKRRYAAGELSEAEFESRLDGLLDADRRADTRDDQEARRTERSRESE